jgi:hypothetical protein
LELLVAALIGLVPTAVDQIGLRAWPLGNEPAAFEFLSKRVYDLAWPGARIGEGIVWQLDVFGLSKYSRDHKADKNGIRADFKEIYPLQVAAIALVNVAACVGFWYAIRTGEANSRRRKIALAIFAIYGVVVGLGVVASIMYGYF